MGFEDVTWVVYPLPTPVGGPPSPYPPLYTLFFDVLRGGSMLRTKYFWKNFINVNLCVKTKKKFSGKNLKIWIIIIYLYHETKTI
jgi:hypothetical protein